MKRIATIRDKDGSTIGLIHGPDALDQSVIVNGKEWRFDFDEYGGPLWLKKNGEERKCQNPNRAVWAAFDIWHEAWKEAK